MTHRALPLLSLGLLLGSCSLINGYDDVAGSGGSASTSSSTGTGTSSGGGGTGGDTSTTSSSSGGGGGAAPTLSCALEGSVVTVFTPTEGTTSRIDAVRVFPQNGGDDRLVVVRSSALQMYDVSEAGTVTPGAATSAMRFLDIRPSGPAISALAVTDSGGGQAQLSVFRWLDNDNIQNPAIATLLAELSNDNQRAIFRHRGPLADDVDVLLTSEDPDNQLFDVYFRRFGIDTPLQVLLVQDGESPEEAEPRAFLQTESTIHAFVGSPMANLGETVRFSFGESDATGGSPNSVGGPGTFLSDLAPSGAGQFNVVIGEFADTTLILRQGKLPNAQLPSFERDDLPAVHTFASLDDVPMSNPPYLVNDTMFAAGITDISGGVGAAWSMLLGKVGALSDLNAIRLDQPAFLELQDVTHTGFGSSAHVNTRDAVSGVGGRMSVAWTERTVGGSDALYLARFDCAND